VSEPPGIPVTAEPNRATVRREVRIARSADEVWAVVGDPSALHTWFPGMSASTVDGTVRIITTDSGIPMPEQILTLDHLQRRFQYRLTAPMVRHHLGTIDVHGLGGDESLVVYATDAEPAAMAIIVGGSTGAALLELKRLLEAHQLEAGEPPSPSTEPGATTEGQEHA